MATGTNGALGYQMMVEDKLLHATINAEMRGSYYTACKYLKNYAKFVGVESIPQEPILAINMGELHQKWVEYYFELWDAVGTRISTNLERIRAMYRQEDDDIPTFKKTVQAGKLVLTN
jgi:hypothetical protein